MPSRSTYARVTLHNLGPLTTTFTARASCTNLASAEDAAYVYGRQVNPDIPNPRGPVACTGRPVADCQPNGQKRDEVEGRGKNLWLYGLAYYSPGLECPAQWTTAGAAGRMGVNATGAFTSDRRGQTATGVNRWIDPSETMALCCPKNYDLETVFYSWCTSSLPPVTDFSYKSLCYQNDPRITVTKTFTAQDGTKLEEGRIDGYQTGTITKYGYDKILPASGTFSADVVFATIPAITLVYKQADKEGNKEGDKKSSSLRLKPCLLGAVSAIMMTAVLQGL